MTVQKSINLTGSAPTIESAVHEALDRANTTLEGVSHFEVTKISGEVSDTGPIFVVELVVWFTLLERMHE